MTACPLPPPKPETQQTPTIGARAAEVIDGHRAGLRSQLARALDGRDVEGVHDMRVASRRLRAALRLFAPWIAPGDLRRVKRSVRDVTRALGTVRELDVLHLRLTTLAEEAARERALAIEFVTATIDRRRRRARARMMARFARVDMDGLDQALARLVARLARSGAGDRLGVLGDLATLTESLQRMSPAVDRLNDLTQVLAPHPARTSDDLVGDVLVLERLGRSDTLVGGAPEDLHHFARRARRPPAPRVPPTAAAEALLHAHAARLLDGVRDVLRLPIAPSGTVAGMEGLHRVRIAAKKLRYELEVLAPLLGDAGRGLLKALRSLQADIGSFHDDAVLEAALDEVLTRCLDRGQSLLASTLAELRVELQRNIERQEQSARSALSALRAGGFGGDFKAALLEGGVAAELVEAIASVPTAPAR